MVSGLQHRFYLDQPLPSQGLSVSEIRSAFERLPDCSIVPFVDEILKKSPQEQVSLFSELSVDRRSSVMEEFLKRMSGEDSRIEFVENFLASIETRKGDKSAEIVSLLQASWAAGAVIGDLTFLESLRALEVSGYLFGVPSLSAFAAEIAIENETFTKLAPFFFNHFLSFSGLLSLEEDILSKVLLNSLSKSEQGKFLKGFALRAMFLEPLSESRCPR